MYYPSHYFNYFYKKVMILHCDSISLLTENATGYSLKMRLKMIIIGYRLEVTVCFLLKNKPLLDLKNSANSIYPNLERKER